MAEMGPQQAHSMLAEAAGRIRAWFDVAWPLWIKHGMDRSGLFYEQLDFAGRPDTLSSRRVRVQGRQLFAFARALEHGHAQAGDMLRRALPAIAAQCQTTSGGWVHLLTPDGRVGNGLRDAYDQAFLLFGLAAATEAGFPEARALADRTWAFLDRELADDRVGGYRESLPLHLPRRSNPHMHLLEAALAWYDVTGERAFLHRANALGELFARHFFDAETGTLGEYFDEALVRLGPPAGDSVEPGHMFEWSWLLHRLAACGGRDMRHEARILHRWALAHGLSRADSNRADTERTIEAVLGDGAALFAIDEANRSGGAVRRTRRAWPQTELIKSLLANGEPEVAGRAALVFLDSYLATKVPGLWIDQFDEDGNARSDVVPASTLYHIVVAFEDLLRVADAG